MKFMKLPLLALFGLVGLLFSSCEKIELAKPMGDRGQTIVKLMTSPNDNGMNYNLQAIDLISTPQTLDVIEIRRDVPNETELNKTLVVSIKEDPTAIINFNTINGTGLVPFPAASYSADPSNPRTGGEYKVTFQPGEFVKKLKLVIPNSTTLDLTQHYAIGLTIVVAVTGADGRVSFENRTAVVEIGLKNKWDGIYSIVSGTVTRYTGPGTPANDALSGSVAGNPDLVLSTRGPYTVEITNLKWAGGTSGVAGIDNLRLTIDPVTNLVTMFSLANASLTNWAGHENKYDPATKTFYLAFKWTSTAPAYREYEMVIRYKGPR